MWPFKKTIEPKVELPKPEVKSVAQEVIAAPPTFNPETNDTYWARYRCDAIARCLEQRREEGLDLHPEHNLMLSEAMSLAWKLVGSGEWTMEQLDHLRHRITG